MRLLARLLWALAVLLVIAAVVAFVLACWAHGDAPDRWAGTGIILGFASALAFGGGMVAELHA